jgi:hypothetical protein
MNHGKVSKEIAAGLLALKRRTDAAVHYLAVNRVISAA